MNPIIKELEEQYKKSDIPAINPGDTVKVFLLNSPRIDKITVLRRGDVRRSKLYYLRERSGKATRIREKIEKR